MNNLSQVSCAKQDLANDIKRFQEEFYKSEPKSILFKNKQKDKCSNAVLEKYELDILTERSIYVIESTKSIFVDYSILKLYINDTILQEIVDHTVDKIIFCMSNYTDYEVHLDLSGFTISALNRYKNLIYSCYAMFRTASQRTGIDFERLLIRMCIYNTPSFVQSIKAIFASVFSPLLNGKMIYYDKIESGVYIRQLFDTNLDMLENRAAT